MREETDSEILRVMLRNGFIDGDTYLSEQELKAIKAGLNALKIVENIELERSQYTSL